MDELEPRSAEPKPRASVRVRATVLLVDDDRDLRQVLRDALSDAGYLVIEATNGQEALESVREGPRADIVLLDLAMPVLSGIGFLRALQADRTLRPPPIVAMSTMGQARLGVEERALITCFLPKPFGIDRLVEVIGQQCAPRAPHR